MLNPIKLTYIHQDGKITGSAISLKNLLKGFAPGQIKATVILSEEGPVRELFQGVNASVKICPFQPFWTFPGPRWYQKSNINQYQAFLKNNHLKDAIKNENPDIIHINDKAALNGGISARELGIPIVQHLRSNYHKTNFRLNAILSAKAIRSYANHLIAISEDELDGFENVQHLDIIYNTIHPEESALAKQNKAAIGSELNIKANDVVVCYVGLLNELKGAWTFIETCGLIKKMLPGQSFKFIIVAPIQAPDVRIQHAGMHMHPLDKAKKLCADHNIETETIFTGYRKDALSIIASANLLLIMNKQGVLGRQPFEAMSVGVPVIAVKGMNAKTDIIRHGQNGLLAGAYEPEEIAKLASELLSDKAKLEKMGNTGEEIALREFNPIINSQKVFHIYQNLLNKS